MNGKIVFTLHSVLRAVLESREEKMQPSVI